jgi:hypothetical protein
MRKPLRPAAAAPYELNSRWTLDGSSRRNVARYANHSTGPTRNPTWSGAK